MEMTREQFMELMSLEEGDDGMDYAEECHAMGESWWDIAIGCIATMDMLIRKNNSFFTEKTIDTTDVGATLRVR